MNKKRFHKLLLVGSGVLVLVVAVSLLNISGIPVSASNVIGLQAPPFMSEANAAGVEAVGTASFLEDEAGIAAYTHTSGAIDLSIVRDEFRAIEQETSQYIIGSVGIADYTENFDPHVYVHTDGWVVAYYLAADPASIIIDLRHYDGVQIDTMLQKAMEQILAVVGIVSFETTYYDFRYPNATNLMLAAEAIYDEGADSFEIKLPNDFTYYERSWTHVFHHLWCDNCELYLDGTEISSLFPIHSGDDVWLFGHNTLTPAQFPPGVFHTIQINMGDDNDPDAFGGIAVIYQENPVNVKLGEGDKTGGFRGSREAT